MTPRVGPFLNWRFGLVPDSTSTFAASLIEMGVGVGFALSSLRFATRKCAALTSYWRCFRYMNRFLPLFHHPLPVAVTRGATLFLYAVPATALVYT